MGALTDQLTAEPDSRERHRIKTEAYAALPRVARSVTRGRFTVTITGDPAIEPVAIRGTRALTFTVRVTRDGVDVTPPDLNPIRIINPPILVPDPAGAIVYTYTSRLDGAVTTLRYREDPAAALLGIIRGLLR